MSYPWRNRMKKLPYLESLGQLLNDLGASDGYIIGNEKGKPEIDWVELTANKIDREITLHPATNIPLRRHKFRPDGTLSIENPAFSTTNAIEYSLLYAKYDGEKISIICNVRIGDECTTKELTVSDLRNELNVALPSPTRQWFYAHTR